jgi:hypothetical protein
MPNYTLRLHGDVDRPEQDVEYTADNDLSPGDQFLIENVWREVVAIADPHLGILLVRNARPIGGFTVGGRYPADLYRDEARVLHERVRRNLQAQHTPERQALKAALAAALAGTAANEMDLSDDTTRELAWTIRSLQVEDMPLTPGIDWLRIQLHRYLDDLDRLRGRP